MRWLLAGSRRVEVEPRVFFCPQCGYCLNGSPDDGKCPECGFGYQFEAIRKLADGEADNRIWLAKAVIWYACLSAALSGSVIMAGIGKGARPLLLIAPALLLIWAMFRRIVEILDPGERATYDRSFLILCLHGLVVEFAFLAPKVVSGVAVFALLVAGAAIYVHRPAFPYLCASILSGDRRAAIVYVRIALVCGVVAIVLAVFAFLR